MFFFVALNPPNVIFSQTLEVTKDIFNILPVMNFMSQSGTEMSYFQEIAMQNGETYCYYVQGYESLFLERHLLQL